jgi:hypothetical protein
MMHPNRRGYAGATGPNYGNYLYLGISFKTFMAGR